MIHIEDTGERSMDRNREMMPMTRRHRTVLKTFLGYILIGLISIVPNAAASQEIEPADVYRLIATMQKDIEQLRWVMGAPPNKQQPPEVRNVSPHEAYFQAITLYDKADRLAFEMTHKDGSRPPQPSGSITPADVYYVLQAARNRIHALGYDHEGFTAAALVPADASRTPTDVFREVVQANRQLNLMLERRYSPSDVFRQITMAGEYAIAIMSTYPSPTPPLQAPPLVPGKRPADVFRHIKAAYDQVKQLADKMGYPMLTLDKWTDDEDAVRPSDVYDVASILVSELAYIHSQRSARPAPPQPSRFYGKIPSEVCQRVGVLSLILDDLIQRSEQ